MTPAFASFLDQAGVPLVTATLSCNGGQGRLALAQERYLPTGSTGDAKGQTWQIPICARYGKGAKTGRACTLLSEKTGELALPVCPDWVMPNEGGAGYYHSGFGDAKGLATLTKSLARLTLPERVSVAYDALALARSGRIDYAQVLELVPQLAAEKSRYPVLAAMSMVGFLRDDGFVDAGHRPQLAKFIRDALGKRARGLGFTPRKGEDEDTRLLRPQLLQVVGNQGEDTVLRAQAAKLARDWLKDHKALDNDLVSVTLELAGLTNDAKLFDELLAAAKTSTVRLDRQRLLAALGDFHEQALAQRALALTLDPSLDARETLGAFWAELRGAESRQLAVDFLGKNFDALLVRLPRVAGASFSNVAAVYCDAARKGPLEGLLKERVTRSEGGPRAYAQAMERLQNCSELRKKQGPGVVAFLAAR